MSDRPALRLSVLVAILLAAGCASPLPAPETGRTLAPLRTPYSVVLDGVLETRPPGPTTLAYPLPLADVRSKLATGLTAAGPFERLEAAPPGAEARPPVSFLLQLRIVGYALEPARNNALMVPRTLLNAGLLPLFAAGSYLFDRDLGAQLFASTVLRGTTDVEVRLLDPRTGLPVLRRSYQGEAWRNVSEDRWRRALKARRTQELAEAHALAVDDLGAVAALVARDPAYAYLPAYEAIARARRLLLVPGAAAAEVRTRTVLDLIELAGELSWEGPAGDEPGAATPAELPPLFPEPSPLGTALAPLQEWLTGLATYRDPARIPAEEAALMRDVIRGLARALHEHPGLGPAMAGPLGLRAAPEERQEQLTTRMQSLEGLAGFALLVAESGETLLIRSGVIWDLTIQLPAGEVPDAEVRAWLRELGLADDREGVSGRYRLGPVTPAQAAVLADLLFTAVLGLEDDYSLALVVFPQYEAWDWGDA